MTAAYALWGALLGSGIWLIYLWSRARRDTLAARIAPYVRAGVEEEIQRRAVTVTPWPTLERLLAPVVRDASRVLVRFGSPAAHVRSRLRRAGRPGTVEQFRAEQVLCGIAGLVVGVALAAGLAMARGASLMPLVILVVVSTAGGVWVREALLTRAVNQRERRIRSELPAVAELLALAVTAGESAAAALERIAHITDGALSEELRLALADCHAGARLPAALQTMAHDAQVPALTRFADGIATAVERGTPLSHVLRAQAHDARAASREELIEEGGKRELAMLIPVVFIILPVTVVFAVFPGITALRIT
ncbi:type II secretion system F family protein [Demequina sediminicola]|uniref:type II secretion system F family protein n=1 Tax=Demequina sediminicola TaxID=1095026 RepID=UPI0007856968|nr:type II secretion system F family protein [Demequina sediminicola]